MESLGVSATFWRDRAVFVTGAAGLVGAWLTRRLVEAGADVVCLVRDWVPQSVLARSHVIDRVKVVRGDIYDRDALERAIGEYEAERCSTWRRRPLPGSRIGTPSRLLKATSAAHGIC